MAGEQTTSTTNCSCKGTLAFACAPCLTSWINEKNDTTCEVCKGVYVGFPAPVPRPQQPFDIDLISRRFRLERIVLERRRVMRSDFLLTCLISLSLVLAFQRLPVSDETGSDVSDEKSYGNSSWLMFTSFLLVAFVAWRAVRRVQGNAQVGPTLFGPGAHVDSLEARATATEAHALELITIVPRPEAATGAH